MTNTIGPAHPAHPDHARHWDARGERIEPASAWCHPDCWDADGMPTGRLPPGFSSIDVVPPRDAYDAVMAKFSGAGACSAQRPPPLSSTGNLQGDTLPPPPACPACEERFAELLGHIEELQAQVARLTRWVQK